MHEVVYDRLIFGSLDEGVERMKAFAKAHVDFEPSLVCERDGRGRRRWVLTVGRRKGGIHDRGDSECSE